MSPPNRPDGRDEAAEMAATFDRLWPLLRSLTGEGVRRTHDILGETMDLRRIEVPSGSEVFDWTVPKEWLVREAYVVTPDGRRILDVADNNLHLLNYSTGFRGTLDRAALDEHLYSKPELPDAIPYITSYYKERWGFCLSESQRRALPEGDYRVVIDAEHIEGSMTLSEALLPGRDQREVLIASYSCHPSLANNELCGPIILAHLYRRIAAWPERRLSYRFVLNPETIGAIAYLSLRGEHLLRKLVAGYVITFAGVEAPLRYKKSRRGDSLADVAAIRTLSEGPDPLGHVEDFSPSGSDERQYCSPGFDLPIGVISRSPCIYPEYHSSFDNRDFISFPAMVRTVDAYEAVCKALDEGRYEGVDGLEAPRVLGEGPRYRAILAHGEPQLGKRGLYPTLGRTTELEERLMALFWVINLADGRHGLADMARRSGHDAALLRDVAEDLTAAGILERLAD